jgi:hypothetical protein
MTTSHQGLKQRVFLAFLYGCACLFQDLTMKGNRRLAAIRLIQATGRPTLSGAALWLLSRCHREVPARTHNARTFTRA